MNLFLLFALMLAGISSSLAEATNLQAFSPLLSSNTQVLWNAPTNGLPSTFWIYRRHGPRIFSASVISNAMVLASLQSKGIPKPPTKDFYIWEDRGPLYSGGIPCVFSISPGFATISYWMPHSERGSGQDIPNDATVVKHAWSRLPLFGVNSNQVKLKNLTFGYRNFDENGRDVFRRFCGRGAFLSRQLDGIAFIGNGDDGSGEGFWIEYGSHEQIRAFSLKWPELDRYERRQTANPKQIIECIRKQKVIVLPGAEESGYFARIKQLGLLSRIYG